MTWKHTTLGVGPIGILAFLAVWEVSAGRACSEDGKQAPRKAPPGSEDGLEVSIGTGFIASPRPYIGTNARTFPVPVVNLEYGRWFFDSIRRGYAFLRSERYDARVFSQVRFRALEPDSSAFLEGMESRRKSMDAGIEVIFRGRPVGFRASAITDVLGRSKGQELSMAAVTGAPFGKTLVLFGFGPRWLSQNRVNYYYGVRASEANPGRPAYVGSSTINWDLTVSAIYNPTPRWTVFGLLTREGLGSDIRSSPLVERSAAYSLVAFVSYNF